MEATLAWKLLMNFASSPTFDVARISCKLCSQQARKVTNLEFKKILKFLYLALLFVETSALICANSFEH